MPENNPDLSAFQEQIAEFQRRPPQLLATAPTDGGATPAPLPPLPEVYYAHYDNKYWATNSHGGYIQLDHGSLKTRLRTMGVSSHRPEDGGPSPLERLIVRIQKEHDLQYAGPLAGYSKGFREMLDSRILVTESPRLVAPRPGNWDTIKAFMEGLFLDEGVDQTPNLYGWLKVGIEALRVGAIRPGQVLVIAGKADAGKSLLQNLITEMLGGRAAKPYQFMTGATNFNAEMFRAEHLIIEDEACSTDMRTRRNFGAMIKNLTVNEVQQCHPKHRTPVSLKPFWRISITVNDEPEHLLVLPPLDESLEDKLMLLKAVKRPMPMPTHTTEQRAAFTGRMVSELPAFIAHLISWQIPEDLKSERFGIRAYHHPELLAAIDDLSPELRFLNIIDAVVFSSPMFGDFEDLAITLERRLTDPDNGFHVQAQTLLNFNNACATYLKRLSGKLPERVSKRRVNGQTLWKVKAPRPTVAVSQEVAEVDPN